MMLRNTTFSGVCTCSVSKLLPALLAEIARYPANRWIGARGLELCEMDAALMPMFAAFSDSKVVAIYEKPPLMGDANGGLLLWMLYKPNPSPACNGRCDGSCCEQMCVTLWQSDRFPCSHAEVAWFLARELQCKDHPWTRLPPAARAMQLAHERAAKTCRWSVQRPSAPAGTGRVKRKNQGRVGAPLIEATVWLQGEIARLGEQRDYNHLYAGWLARYELQFGRKPGDPKRSFRQAVEGCLARLYTN